MPAIGENQQHCFSDAGSVWLRSFEVEDTVAGLVLQQHGMWQRAQEVFFHVMTKAQSNSIKINSGAGTVV